MPDDHRFDQVISGRRPRYLVAAGVVALGAAVALLAIGVAVGRGRLLVWAAVAAVLALIYVYAMFSSARAYTRFGPVGVRTRGLWGGTDEYRWDQIANVAVQQVIYYRTAGMVSFVVVTTKAGDHVRLGAPVSGTGSSAEFPRQFRQIRAAWQQATGIVGTPETTAPTWSKEAASLGAAIGVQALALAVVFVTLPYFLRAWAVHSGTALPTAGVTAGTAIVLLLFTGELLVPIYRRRARHRRVALAVARPAQARLPAPAFDDFHVHGPAARKTKHHLRVGLTRITTAPEQSPKRASRGESRRRRRLHP
jgi:hypothetical protein